MLRDMFEYSDIRDNSIIEKYINEYSRRIEQWSDDVVEQYVKELLEDLLLFVYNNNSYYRKILDEAGYDTCKKFDKKAFSKIHILEKNEIRDDCNLIRCIEMSDVAQIHVSTGTTGGEMIYMMYSFGDLYTRDGAIEYYPLVNIEKGDIVANAMPYEMSSSGLSFHRVIQNFSKSTVIPVGKGGFYSEPMKTLKIICDMHCNKVITTPSYAAYLAKVAKESNFDLSKNEIEIMWLTGEGCSDNFRKRLEQMWGCKCHFYYGSLECGALGIECTEHEGYHLPNASVLIEILDVDTGEPLEDGEIGEIVVTTLTREACPLIRFATGDVGYIENELCECGNRSKRLFLRGRKCEQIEFDGKSYSPIYIEQYLMECPEVGNDFRFVINNDHIVIQASFNNEYGEANKNKIARRIASYVEYSTGVPNKVEFVDDFVYEGGKTKRVIDNRKVGE